jgi:hypothetical protein
MGSFLVVKTKTAISQNGLPKNFINRFGGHVTAILSGLDRVRFRATLRPLFCPEGPEVYLNYCKVLIKNFKSFAQGLSDRVKKRADEQFQKAERPNIYLPSSQLDKESLIEQMVLKEQIKQGPIALLSCVEPCLSFRVRWDHQTKKPHLVMESARCTHLYHYYEHPKVGRVHIRVQTWFPFSVDVCLNGRQWLARQMERTGIGYRQCDNCFSWIEDYAEAQKLMDQQLRHNWAGLMNSFLALAHPLAAEITAPMPGLSYYWSISQSEYATDVLFDSSKELARLYPKFLRHAITTFQSPDVMRFLGRRVPQSGTKVHGNFQGEVTSGLKERAEGVRIRHTLNGNSLKMYDKAGNLRVETTMLKPTEFKVYRSTEGQAKQSKRWMRLRKGVCDMYRRAQVCRAANTRYLEALACVTGSSSLLEEAAQVCRPVIHNGKRYRGLNALAQKDHALLLAVSRGEFILSGIRNADLRASLYQPSEATKLTKAEIRRRSAVVTRQFALLRAHGLLRKMPRSHRYQLTSKGRRIITALLAACYADVEQLTKIAA